jgi:P27 family predicted phage terminase small subunit
MTAGRPPKPTELKRRTGNPGKRKLPDSASVIALPQVSMNAPIELSEKGQALWIKLREQAPWIANTDGRLLFELCSKVDFRDGLKEQLAQSNPVLYTDKGYAYANPLVGMISSADDDIIRILSLLGLTPADRTKLGVAEVKARGKLQELLQSKNAQSG